ncbi:hypothetical protein CHS0354_029015 [Potamilus streckersoni]|uniref:Uncharacterized protein n=1 Tax=Potamilus streckersoni TaxID=2493646 RepID=A0AAE0VV38_9BIVA|nr:hypothetical protein CHS0354_029015 [Potamilus streckersoni]
MHECMRVFIVLAPYSSQGQGKFVFASSASTTPALIASKGMPYIEMKPLVRQSSTASSSDTYTSCLTHLPTSPSIKGHNSSSETYHHNCYVNPLEDNISTMPSYDFGFYEIESSNSACMVGTGGPKRDKSMNRNNKLSDQIIQKIDDGFTTTWQRVNSPPPLQGHHSQYGASNNKSKRQQQCDRSHGGSLKRHKSDHGRHPHFGEVMERTFSSTDNIHNLQGLLPKPKLKFRKAVSLANRLHGSPSTGRRLANYHIIASSKSGKSENTQHLLAAQEDTATSSTRRSTSCLLDSCATKRKSILKKEAIHKNESENLLKSGNRYHSNGAPSNEHRQNYNSCNSSDQYNKFTAAPLTPRSQESSVTFPSQTGNNISLSHPVKQVSTDSYTSDSQLNTFDRSDEELEFSDSFVNNQIETVRSNIWHNSDGFIPHSWATDTSPSDNLENDESYLGSISYECTPSDDASMSDRNSKMSPTGNANDLGEINRYNDNSMEGSEYSKSPKVSTFDNIMNNIPGESTSEETKNLAFPDASG